MTNWLSKRLLSRLNRPLDSDYDDDDDGNFAFLLNRSRSFLFLLFLFFYFRINAGILYHKIRMYPVPEKTCMTSNMSDH